MGAEPLNSSTQEQEHHGHSLAALTLGSLGVVFGDIGTSPLYTVQECFGPHGAVLEEANVLGILSLIFWALMMVVTFKYVLVLMNADNRGEGGIMALLSLVPERQRVVRAGRIGWISLLVIAGASLLFGDGIITPAISVLSAIEGLGVADPRLATAVVPVTVAILVVLFSIQSRGTGALGKLFGPIMVFWFVSIGILGLLSLWQTPSILRALSPHHGALFFLHHGWHSITVLGSVVLAVTGGEALYADMGHFGRKPIRLSWLGLVLPSLLFCYLGQGALLLRQPASISSPFFSLVDSQSVRFALVFLAAAATVIASQGLISAVFSLTQQAVRLGYFPRVQIRHTSDKVEGQIYVPAVNWTLAVACLALVVIFQKSTNLAAAFGLAVSGTMGITSVVFAAAARHHWKWPAWKANGLMLLFLSFDIPFFLGTCVKFFEGGYIPFAVGLVMFSVMVLWCRGRSLVHERRLLEQVSQETLLKRLVPGGLHRTPGLGVYLGAATQGLPPVLVQQMRHFDCLPQEIVLLSATTESVPYVSAQERVELEALEGGAYRVIGRYGYMEMPDIPKLLESASHKMTLSTPWSKATYFIGRESFAATRRNKMGAVSETLFATLAALAVDVTRSFSLPPESVVELGARMDL